MSVYYHPSANWSLIPEHMRERVIDYVMKGVPNGSFLTAVFANDLAGAAMYADLLNKRRLWEWSVFMHNWVPIIARGSYEKVEAWIKRGGLEGLDATPDPGG